MDKENRTENIRKPHGIEWRSERETKWKALARAALLEHGPEYRKDFAEKLLHWIDIDDLGAALEEAGLLKSVTVTEFLTTDQVVAGALKVLQENFKKNCPTFPEEHHE